MVWIFFFSSIFKVIYGNGEIKLIQSGPPQNHIEYTISLCRTLLTRATQARLLLLSILVLVLAIVYGSVENWNTTKDVGNTYISPGIKYDGGYYELYQSRTVFKPSVLCLNNRSAINELVIKLEAESQLRNGPVIAKMWNQFSNNLSSVLHSAQELNARGKYDLYLLFLEFKTLSNRKRWMKTNLEVLTRKISNYLSTMLNLLEDLEALIVQTEQLKAAVQSTLYTTEKRLQLDLEEDGLARWLILHFRGNRALLLRRMELRLIQQAIRYSTGASEFLSTMETNVKLCKDSIISVKVSEKIKTIINLKTSCFKADVSSL